MSKTVGDYRILGKLGGGMGVVYEKEEAFQWLEKGFAEKSEAMQYVKSAAALDKIRSDPRYPSLIKRMNLPD